MIRERPVRSSAGELILFGPMERLFKAVSRAASGLTTINRRRVKQAERQDDNRESFMIAAIF